MMLSSVAPTCLEKAVVSNVPISVTVNNVLCAICAHRVGIYLNYSGSHSSQKRNANIICFLINALASNALYIHIEFSLLHLLNVY